MAAETLQLSLLDVVIQVTAERHVLAPLRHRFASCIVESGMPAIVLDIFGRGPPFRLRCGPREIEAPLPEAWPSLSALVQALIMQERPGLHFLHAAAVARNGQATLLCGPSTSGKSTLATGLREGGWVGLCDDCAPVNIERRQVLPFWTTPGRCHVTRHQPRHTPPPATLCQVVFLVPVGGRPVPGETLQQAAARWKLFRGLLRHSTSWKARGNTLSLRGPGDFSGPPRLSACAPADAVRQWMQFSMSPVPSLGTAFARMQLLFPHCHFHRLEPGSLAATLDLLESQACEEVPG
ncbi:MAG: hypothetical protein HYV26_04720 [Candidatus Hydrogenedentes bacterium]|nr:hypothetical protein [Candidatus Hydrogenedentota bacterium]